jgi:hypothetical protein
VAQDDNRDETILETAQRRFKLAAEAEMEIRKLAIDDLKFRAGEQWPDEIKTQRDIDHRPCLTINRLPQFLRQITNDQRQNRPSIKVNPVDSKATEETAEVLEGMIRHIEYQSNASIAYDTAFDGVATHGFGYFRIITGYASPDSFDQEIKIKRIKNPFNVYLDPAAQEPDGSDANWGFVVDQMSKDEFKAQFKNAKLSAMDDWESVGDTLEDWVQKDGARVADYYYKVNQKTKIYLMSDGSVVPEKEMPSALPEGITVVDERTTTIPKVMWCKICGTEILEETEWLGTWIPIVPAYGDEIIIEGRRILEGVIRHAKDSQRMYNYWASAETETISLAPKAPFIGAEGQFEGHETAWKSANTKNQPFLEYKPKDIAGTALPAPQRNVIEPPVQAITNARSMAAEDLKATTGIYDPSLGNRDADQSGIAIQRLNNQSQTSNFHLIDNFARSLRHAGRIIVELIPKIYDSAQAVRIINADDTQEMVLINQMFQKGQKVMSHDLDLGRYDVTVSTGPSYQTKRQEAVASMMDLTKAYPNIVQIAGDLLVKNMDWPGSDEIAERLKKTLPPGLQQDDDGEQPQIPPQAQQMIMQFRQQNQQLTQALNQLNQVIETKKLELESKERIALKEMETELVVEQMRIDAMHSQTAFKAEVSNIHKRLDLIGDLNPIGPQDSQNQTGAGGPQPAATPQSPQQPTGGSTPGQPMGA